MLRRLPQACLSSVVQLSHFRGNKCPKSRDICEQQVAMCVSQTSEFYAYRELFGGFLELHKRQFIFARL